MIKKFRIYKKWNEDYQRFQYFPQERVLFFFWGSIPTLSECGMAATYFDSYEGLEVLYNIIRLERRMNQLIRMNIFILTKLYN